MLEDLTKELLSMKNDIDKMKQQIRQLEADKGKGTNDEGKIFDIDELSAYLNISKATLYNIHKGNVKSFKIGRNVKFKKKDVDEWIQLRTLKTNREIMIENNTQQFIRGNRRMYK